MKEKLFDIFNSFFINKMEFKRKGKSWHTKKGNLILIIEIQFSSFSNKKFYVNFGYYLPNLLSEKGSSIPTKVYDCYITSRINTISPELDNIEIPQVFEIPEDAKDFEEYIVGVLLIFENHVLPFLFIFLDASKMEDKVEDFYNRNIFNITNIRKADLLQFLHGL